MISYKKEKILVKIYYRMINQGNVVNNISTVNLTFFILFLHIILFTSNSNKFIS